MAEASQHTTPSADAPPTPSTRARPLVETLVRDHVVPFCLYALISIGVTWPLARDFTTRMTGSIFSDQLHSLWLLEHFRRWLDGAEPLFFSTSLYFPVGSSLLLDGVGPISGLMALPFSWAGPVAGYNGAALTGFTLTGYCMYLLARGVGLSSGVAFVSGAILQLAPVHMVSMHGHLERTFIGLPALSLLGLHRVLEPRRSWWWAIATAALLLLTALYTASQLVFTGLAAALIALTVLVQAAPADRAAMLRRLAILAACCVVIVGPYLWAVRAVARDPAYFIALGQFSAYYSPDATQLVLPSAHSAVFGWAPFEWIDARPHEGLDIAVETAVGLSWTALILSVVALRFAGSQARPWIICALGLAVVSLGPSLRLFGHTTFTSQNLRIVLPYTFLSRVPGLDSLRVPGRFMIVGMAALAVAAGLGLQSLSARAGRRRAALIAAAVGLLLLESWPRRWPQWHPETSYPTPPFYQLIKRDAAQYGVLDIPFVWPPGQMDVAYLWHQLTHGKPIAWGYLSRQYIKHPVPLVQRALTSGAAARDPTLVAPGSNSSARELQSLGYRYVVWHKTYPDMPSAMSASSFVDLVFGPGARPFFEDDMVRVFRVPSEPPGENAIR